MPDVHEPVVANNYPEHTTVYVRLHAEGVFHRCYVAASLTSWCISECSPFVSARRGEAGGFATCLWCVATSWGPKT